MRANLFLKAIERGGPWKSRFFWALKWQCSNCCIYSRGRNVFDATNPFLGVGPKNWALLGPEMATRKASAIWARKSKVFFSNLTLISKCLSTTSSMRIRIRIVFISCHQCCAAGPGEEAAATAGQLQPLMGQDWASRGADTPRNSSGQRLQCWGSVNIFFKSGSADLDLRFQFNYWFNRIRILPGHFVVKENYR